MDRLPDGSPNSIMGLTHNAPNAPVSPLWARDACRCPECRDPQNGQHLIDSTDLDGWHVVASDRTPTELRVLLRHDDGRQHQSIIPSTDDSSGFIRSTQWGAPHGDRLAARRVSADGSLDQFVSDLAEFGIAIVDGVPTKSGAILDFVGQVGFVRATNYGELFDVRTTPDAINLAFTPKGLPLHTDNPYRDPVPTVQVLHCLRSARSGGGSIFSDGFAAAEQLRREDRTSFDILAATPVTFRFRSDDTDLVATVPMIELDVSGNVRRVTINNRSMEPIQPAPGADAFYRAYQRFCEVLAAPERTVEITLDEGQLIAFDNRRVLHGRNGYAESPERHLQGCYVDIDAFNSAARLIAQRV